MSRSERLLLLAFFVVVLAALAWREPTAAAVGAVLGTVPGVLAAARLNRLSTRMDTRLGIVEERRRGVRPRPVLGRAGLHLGLLGVVLLTTIVVPFIGDELFAAAASFVTAGAAALTASRLRR